MSTVREFYFAAVFGRDCQVLFDCVRKHVHQLDFVSKRHYNVETRRMECNCNSFLRSGTIVFKFKRTISVIPNVNVPRTRGNDQLLTKTNIHARDGGRVERCVNGLSEQLQIWSGLSGLRTFKGEGNTLKLVSTCHVIKVVLIRSEHHWWDGQVHGGCCSVLISDARHFATSLEISALRGVHCIISPNVTVLTGNN